MKKIFALFIFFFTTNCQLVFSQEHLPNISLTEHNNKVIVSWQNFYKKSISNILIQRSYDSLRNFSTIGTVLNPLNKENGYLDSKPPYNRMYYRVLISFEGGSYEIGKSSRPEIEPDDLDEFNVTAINETDSIAIFSEIKPIDSIKLIIEPIKKDTLSLIKKEEIKIIDTPKIENNDFDTKINSIETLSLQKNSFLVSPLHISIINSTKLNFLKKIKPITTTLANKIIINTWDYPSNRVFINNQNLITIQLKKTAIRKYSIIIYDELDNLVLDIKKINEDFFYLDKSNFRKSGWYHYILLNDGEIVEKNKFQILKDKSPK